MRQFNPIQLIQNYFFHSKMQHIVRELGFGEMRKQSIYNKMLSKTFKTKKNYRES